MAQSSISSTFTTSFFLTMIDYDTKSPTRTSGADRQMLGTAFVSAAVASLSRRDEQF